MKEFINCLKTYIYIILTIYWISIEELIFMHFKQYRIERKKQEFIESQYKTTTIKIWKWQAESSIDKKTKNEFKQLIEWAKPSIKEK